MVVPDIQLRNLAICCRERLRAVPANVVLEVEVVASLPELLRKWIIPPLLRVRDISPFSQWTADTNTVIINLVTASDP